MAGDFDIDEELARQEAEESEKELPPLENAGLPPVDPNFEAKQEEKSKTDAPVDLDVSELDIVKALKVAQEGIQQATSEFENADVVEAPEKPAAKSVDPRAERPKVELPEDLIENEMKPTATPRAARRRVTEGQVQKVELIRYTVGPGEKLRNIAKRFGTSATAIEKLNRLSNPRHLVRGQELLINAKKGAK